MSECIRGAVIPSICLQGDCWNQYVKCCRDCDKIELCRDLSPYEPCDRESNEGCENYKAGEDG